MLFHPYWPILRQNSSNCLATKSTKSTPHPPTAPLTGIFERDCRGRIAYMRNCRTQPLCYREECQVFLVYSIFSLMYCKLCINFREGHARRQLQHDGKRAKRQQAYRHRGADMIIGSFKGTASQDLRQKIFFY